MGLFGRGRTKELAPWPFDSLSGGLSDAQQTKSLRQAWADIALLPGGVLIPRASEVLLGYRPDVGRFQLRSRRARVPGAAGVGISLRVTRGVWLHPHIRTPAVYHTEQRLEPHGVGDLHLTTRRVYFAGLEKNVEFSFAKMDVLPRWTKDGYIIIAHGTHEELLKVGGEREAYGWSVVLAFLVHVWFAHAET